MASESSIRCKRWREKRKDDVEYWNQERSRKREARRTRPDEKKQHDRELSRKRQKKFRDRKKQKRCKESSSVIEVDGPTVETGIVTEDVSSGSHDADMSANLISVPESDYMLLESDAITSSNFRETYPDGIKDGNSPTPDLHYLKSNRSAKETAPHINLIQNEDGKGIDIINNDNARQAYFETIQTKLSLVEDFNSVKSRCNSISQYIEQTFSIRDLPTLDVRGYHLDNVASTLYPHDDSPNNLVPIRTVGDGNCLPRVGSLFAFGNEKHHVEMRVRIFMELCQFEDYYLDDSYLNRGTEKSVGNIAMTLAQYSVDYFLTDKHMCREAFRKYMNAVLQPNTFNGIWSIFALASVLGVQIFSIYPSYGGYNVRRHLHRQVMPRICRHDNDRIVHIMWTSTQGKQQEPSSWTPNHFVAVLPTQEPIHSSVQEDRVGPKMLNIQVGTDQSGLIDRSDVHSGITPSNPMDVPSKYRPNEKVETPTFITLQNVSREYSTVPLIHEAPERTILLQQTGHDNPTMPSLSVSEGSVDGNDTQRRHEDRCLSHPNEELLYLCTTCNGLPICYKCHLQGHQCHKLTDLKACLAESETLYVTKLTKKEEHLKDDIEKRKLDHVRNMQCIESEIEDAHTFYKEQLTTWVCNQKACVRDRDQNIRRQLQDLAAQIGNPDTSVEEKLLELRKLPVSQRLSVMSTEPQQETISGGYPRTKLVFRDRPVHFLGMLGTLAEIPCQSDISTTDGSMQAAYGSEPLRVPDGDNGRTQAEREGPRKSTNGTAKTDLSTMNNYDKRFKGLEGNILESSMFTQNDHAWIPGSIETLTNNHQQSPHGTSHNVQSSAYGRLEVPLLNGPIQMLDRLSPVQNSTGTQINEVETELNHDHVTFAGNTRNENKCTRLDTSNVIKADIWVKAVKGTDYDMIGSHHHIHRSTTDIATEPFMTTNFSQTTSKQRHCDPGFTGLVRMETQNSRNSETRKYVSEGQALDTTVHPVNLIPADKLTHIPTGILNDVGNVVIEFLPCR
ncbi:uncharacterized protein LOC110443481 isoform X1 [Mizuhopecten yessoensis]|uniref:uncharacterized protein LOC110443481 isoform X1 n=1 Tax=Mizuhopecten yessoensis TaxID=6573 RepID=UPI000B457C0A|nr:uncharacterized protein LOC110443481 isoform X1 [Mizuhopecten yessoensis]XP_021343383.1 uncharacterized protein LOC110443481 isoform X1 [Mizuhopecten yessoensis]XP_021343384.1 uncharacterized protein LOC110443481 isoform X1 [Mizuhopecten yessoensis]